MSATVQPSGARGRRGRRLESLHRALVQGTSDRGRRRARAASRLTCTSALQLFCPPSHVDGRLSPCDHHHARFRLRLHNHRAPPLRSRVRSPILTRHQGRGADNLSRSADTITNSLRPIPRTGAAGADIDDADDVHSSAARFIRDVRAQVLLSRFTLPSCSAHARVCLLDPARQSSEHQPRHHREPNHH